MLLCLGPLLAAQRIFHPGRDDFGVQACVRRPGIWAWIDPTAKKPVDRSIAFVVAVAALHRILII
jgi:hypothetical protein